MTLEIFMLQQLCVAAALVVHFVPKKWGTHIVLHNSHKNQAL